MRRILIVDDSLDDWILIRRALTKRQFACSVFEVDAVALAIQYLQGESKFSDRAVYPLPEIILCDAVMPQLDGFALLDFINDHGFRDQLSVALMSGSISKEMRERAVEKGACACINKNEIVRDAEAFVETMECCLHGILTT